MSPSRRLRLRRGRVRMPPSSMPCELEAERRLAASAGAVEEALRKARAENEAATCRTDPAEGGGRGPAGEGARSRGRGAPGEAGRRRREAQRRSRDRAASREQVRAAADRAREEAAKQYAAELEGVQVRSRRRTRSSPKPRMRRSQRVAQRVKPRKPSARPSCSSSGGWTKSASKVREHALKERDDEYRLKDSGEGAPALRPQGEARRGAAQGGSGLAAAARATSSRSISTTLLSDAFPDDRPRTCEEGPEGRRPDPDCPHPSGVVCGRIKWESKHTQNWC